MRPRTQQRGFTLVETIVAMGLALVVLGAVFGVVAGLQKGARENVPRASNTITAAGLGAELADTIADAAAKMRYYDHAATMADVRARIRAASGGGGGSGGTGEPPKEESRGSTGGAGGGTGGGGSLPSSIAHEVSMEPVFRVGDGLLWKTAGEELSIAGPVAVWREGALGVGEAGPSLTVVRTDAASACLRLGAAFYTAGEAIRFVARDREAIEVIENLGQGIQLSVVGRDAGGRVRSVLVELRGAPRLVSVPSPSNPDGTPVFVYYEAPCHAPGEPTALGGLYNRREIVEGLTIGADATVAILDRTSPVVSYYVRRDDRGELRLARYDGRIGEGVEQELPGELAGELRIETALAPEAAGLTEADRLQSVTLELALRTPEGDGQPVRSVLELRDGAARLSETMLYWDVVGGGAAGGGGK